MCLIQKCCLCVPLNVGSLILGYMSAIIYGKLYLFFSVILIFAEQTVDSIVAGYQYDVSPELAKLPLGLTKIAIEIISSLGLIICGTGFLFSAFLIHGVHKKRPGYVKAYFVYGVITVVLSVLAIINGFIAELFEASIILLGLTAFYIHWLVVVYSTYRTMQNGEILCEPMIQGRTHAVDNIYMV